VGTVTEIYDYLRLLFSRIGTPHCPKCNQKITGQTVEAITDSLLRTSIDRQVLIIAPIIRAKKGTYEKLIEEIRQKGYSRVRLDGEIINIDSDPKDPYADDKKATPKLDKQKKHTVEVVVDRLQISSDEKSRLFESIQTALRLGNGLAIASLENKDTLYSQRNACVKCGISIGELEPRNFSFNSPFGACSGCNGLGIKIDFDPDLVVPDRTKSILDGAIKPWTGRFATFRTAMLRDVGKQFNFDLRTRVADMTDEQLNVILYGTERVIQYRHESRYSDSKWEYSAQFEGVIPSLERTYRETESDSKRDELLEFMREKACETCRGKRLKDEILAVKIQHKSIMDVCDLSIRDTYNFFEHLALSETDRLVAKVILQEIKARLEFLINVGLTYLTLNRMSASLSGGESQRIRLATQIGSNLTGVLYVLDEPTIGLHQRDNTRLISTLRKLRDLDNTLIVVEHDEEVTRSSDWIVDIGPGAGVHGGKVVAIGPIEKILESKESITGAYLRGEACVSARQKRRAASKWLTVYGARENNLKSIDVRFPIGCMIAITGVSGSGKSTLVNDILYRHLAKHFHNSKDRPGRFTKLTGLEHIDNVIGIDQSPIGRTPRSNAVTYINAFTPIREIFSRTQTAKEHGYSPGRFSFNVSEGRCESCEGAGVRRIEMQFLPDVYVVCDECKGRRYNSETLKVMYKGKNISDILDMTVEEALIFFQNIPTVRKKLQTLDKVGLGYIKIGQPATTLSGGEAQRIKLSAELSKRDTGRTLYILDEPTTGLHFADVSKLLDVLDSLVSLGNTVIVIEHNLDVISSTDWIIDLGPEGGEGGGEIVAVGTPEEIASCGQGYTSKFLRPKLSIDQLVFGKGVKRSIQ
jgi:excinuclease ABC subunit A